MNNSNGAIWYSTAIDNAGLRQGQKEAKAIWSQMEGDASAAGMSVQKIWSMIGVAGAGIAAKQLIGQIVQVRGEMQMLEKSFAVLLQSEEKSAKMLSEIRALATESPLEMTHVSQAAQTLLGFGVDAEKVMGIVRQLSDVSMGNSDRFQRLSLVYAQTQAAGKLMGQDLLQMINAGFNPLQIISEQTGKSIATLKDEMSTGAISAQMVADAFAAVTSEGGKFYQMTQKQASGIVGLKASFQDAVTMMFNDLGKANEGVIADAIKGATYLVENYEKVGKILLEIAATYGVYRAALISINAINTTVAATKYAAEAASLYQLLSAEQKAAISKKGLSVTSAEYFALVKLETAANVQAAESALVKARADVKAASQAVAARRAEYIAAKQLEAQQIAELMSIGATGTKKQVEIATRKLSAAETKRETAAIAWQSTTRDLNAKKTAVETAARTANTVASGVNTAAETANATATGILTTMKNQLTAATKRLTSAMLKNPWALAAAAVAALAFGIYKLVTQQTAAEKAQERLNKRMEEFNEIEQERRSRIDELIRIIQDETQTLYAQITAYEELQKLSPALTDAYTREELAVAELAATNRELNAEQDKRNYDKLISDIDNVRKSIVRLKEMFDLMASNPDSGFGLLRIGKQIEEQEAGLAILEQNLSDYNKRMAEAEFNALPPAEKIKIKEEQLAKIRSEFDKVNSAINEEIAKLPKEVQIPFRVEVTDGQQPNGLQQYGENWLNWGSQSLGVQQAHADALRAEEQALRAEIDAIEKGDKKKTELSEEDRKRLADEARRRRESAEKAAKDIYDLRSQLADDAAQAEVDKMVEGAAKKRAQANLDFEREKADIIRRQEELRELQGGTLKDEQNAQFASLNVAATAKNKAEIDAINKEEIDAEQEKIQALQDQYADYVNRRIAIEEKFNADRVAMYDNSGNLISSFNQSHLDEWQRQFAEALSELDATMQDSSSLWGQLFDDFSHRTNVELTAIINNAREVLNYINNTPSANIEAKFGLTREQLLNLKGNAAELGAAYDALHEKINQFNQRNPFAALLNSAKSLRSVTTEIKKAQEELDNAQKKGDKDGAKSAKDRLKTLERQKDLLKGDLKEAAVKAVDYLGDVAGALQQIGEASGDSGLSSFGKTLEELSGIAGKFLSGDIIGGTISAITTGLTAIFSSAAKYRAALKQMRDDRMAFEHEYALALSDMRIAAEDKENIFGEDMFAKAIDALKELRRLYDEFIARVNSDSPVLEGSGPFGYVEALRDARLEARGLVTDLQKIWVQTQHSTWFRSEKGFYLGDQYKELFSGENGFDVEAARVLLDTNNQLSEEARRKLQEVIDLYDQMKEAEAAFKEYMSSTFGEIGNTFGDSIVSAFEDGTDAMENWAQSFDNVLKNLAKQLMQTLFFQKYFDKLQEDLTTIYGQYGDDPNRIATEVTNLLDNFFASMGGVVDQADDWYQWFVDNAKDHGFDLTDDTTREASSKGIATASQDSVDELNGRMTAIQGHTFSIMENQKLLLSNSNRALQHLSAIEVNTFELHAMRNDMSGMRADIGEMRSDLRATRQTVGDIKIKGHPLT